MLGVIADDLTGAAELGGVGLSHGLRAEIVVRGQPSGEASLTCIDTDSRGCGPKEASRRAALAALRLRACGARWIYKKVDSVLRGHLVAELEAVMHQLGVNRALLVPANPSLGRTISDGSYFIHGRPIHKTEFAHDVEYPRVSPRVPNLLQASDDRAICIAKPHGRLPPYGIVVGEARSSADLRRWAMRGRSDSLPAGGAEFFSALLTKAGYKRAAANAKRAPTPGAGPHLFVCGTWSESSRKFVIAARRRGAPVFSLPRELAREGRMMPVAVEAMAQKAIAALRLNPTVILHVGLPQVHDPQVARGLATHLVRVAASVLRQGRIRRLYVEGGATAIELVRHMGWRRLTPLCEVSLGVATLRVAAASSVCLTMKPGSYVWPRQIRELIV